jgi:hypothetical protein
MLEHSGQQLMQLLTQWHRCWQEVALASTQNEFMRQSDHLLKQLPARSSVHRQNFRQHATLRSQAVVLANGSKTCTFALRGPATKCLGDSKHRQALFHSRVPDGRLSCHQLLALL